MAKIRVRLMGIEGSQPLDQPGTVADLIEQLMLDKNTLVTCNGTIALPCTKLRNYDYVVIAPDLSKPGARDAYVEWLKKTIHNSHT